MLKPTQGRRFIGWWGVAILVLIAMGPVIAGMTAGASAQQTAYARWFGGTSSHIKLSNGDWLGLASDGMSIKRLRLDQAAGVSQWELPTSRRGASMTLLADGQVLVWGGQDEDGANRAGGLWLNPDAEGLKAAEGIPLAARALHSATVLTDGRVLVAGGSHERNAPYAQVWDPIAGSIQDIQAPNPTLLTHKAELRPDGRVLLYRGLDSAQRVQGPAIRFDPQSVRLLPENSQSHSVAANAPLIAGSIPEQGEQGVDPLSRIALRFREPVRMGEGTASIALLGPAGNVSAKAVLVENGRLLFVTPAQELLPNSPHTLAISGLRSSKGVRLPPIALDFRTAALAEDGSLVANPEQTSSLPLAGSVKIDGCGPQKMLPCRKRHTLEGGVWRPGRDNTLGRWRINGARIPLGQNPYESVLAKAGTGVTGRVVRVDQTPVANVEVSIGSVTAKTNEQGWFLLANITPGKQELYVDGTTARTASAEFGQFVVGIEVPRKGVLTVPYLMHLPQITSRDKLRIPSPLTRDVTLTHPDMPGLEVTIPSGTAIRDRKGKLVTELAIVPMPVDRAPFPVPENYPIYFSIQPGGAVIQALNRQAARGVTVRYPNYGSSKPGTTSNFWIYEPANGWRVYGQGTLSQDGAQFVPEKGVALHQMMGGGHTLPTYDPASDSDLPCCHESKGSAMSGHGATGGDPVDLATGKFFYDETDLTINDIIPISVSRSYRPHDVKRRYFGVGTTLGYDYYLHASSSSADQVMVVLPSGSSVTFERAVSTDDDHAGHGRWVQKGSETMFSGAVLESGGHLNVANEEYWLTLRDGTRYVFGSAWDDPRERAPLHRIVDRFGNRIDLIYEAGYVSRIISTSGRFIDFAYDSENRIQTATDSIGRIWTYAYNADGMLASVTYPDQNTRTYTYNVHHNTSSAEPDQVEWHRFVEIYNQRGNREILNVFDNPGGSGPGAAGRVISQTLADGGVYTFNYAHVDGSTTGTLMTLPDGSKRRLVFDPATRYPVTDTVGYGTSLAQTTTFERNASGQISARVDSLNRRTEYGYDTAGRITSVKVMAGTAQARTVTMTYNVYGDVATVKDPLNRITTFGYTNRCLTSITDPMNRITQLTCNASGQPLTVSDPLNKTKTLVYEGTDLTKVIDPLGREVRLQYDNLGRVISVQDAGGNLSWREYDDMGRIATSHDPAGKAVHISYDGNGNVTAVLLPHGNGITYAYDARDRLKERTDSLNQTESWTYDFMDRITTYTDRKNQETSFEYDTLGRPTLTTYPVGGGTITANYDAADRLISLADSLNGVLGWSYNDFDQVTEATSDQGGIEYAYDAAGRRTSMAASSQALVEYDYDDADRLTQILQGTESVSFDYDDADRLTKLTLPNQVSSVYTYNDASELTGLAWGKDGQPALGSLGYGYDHTGQLVRQTGNYAASSLPPASVGVNVFDDNHRQTFHNGHALTYDSLGNLTGDGTHTYIWNARNQLIQIKQGASVVANYNYDALGRRVGRTEFGVSTAYLYDGFNVVQETQGAVVNPILTGLGVDQRYARNDNGGRSYFLTDRLGSTRALTDASGVIVNRYDYDPYGSATQTSTGFTNPYQYTGREYDMSGLSHYRARYYSASMSRFISEDPIQLAGGLNTYAYVDGNPVMWFDPYGLFCISPRLKAGISGAAAGAASGAMAGGLAGALGGAALGGVVGYAFGSNEVGAGAVVGGISAGYSTGTVRGALVGTFAGGLGGVESASLAAGTMGAYEGVANARRAINPTGWNAVAGPALKGIRSGVVGWAASEASEQIVDFVNEQWGDCGCGK